ncbi:RTA1 domain protein [Purpureocillium lavendulum]|uniref:RTA1 domain protein n=1 Tax=Purpureocillium lavendulum TaxID=1247861 RepID=A0AB34FX23_9HYPO|nr:RTA1 domain protein [Purpureocillium lavendulum]
MTVQVTGKPVGPIGFGLLGLTISAALSDEQRFAAIKAALESGCNYFNGGEFYGTPEENSLTLLNQYLAAHPEDADRIVLNVKGGLGPNHTPAGSRKDVAKSIDNVLRLLGPQGRIAQFEVGRKDPNVDYEEETLATIDEYVKSGKIGGISLSEVSAATIRSAAKRFKITGVETELSLFHTDPLTNGILETCGELGIPVIAYSAPLGRGFLGGQLKSLDDLPANDRKRIFPRFQENNFYKNLELVRAVEDIAKRKGCTIGQIAIGWVVAMSRRPGMPTIIPIPGSSKPERVRENATLVDLTDAELKEIDEILKAFVPAGERYPERFMAPKDSGLGLRERTCWLLRVIYSIDCRLDAVLRVTRQDISVGGFVRSTALVNGTTPGPALRIPENEIVWIRVYNDMKEDNLTMHWHGLGQAAYPFSDGTPLASQWPIPPMHFFDYELKSPRGSAGTYYYHSHVGFQANTAAGPLIVQDDRSAPAPYHYDDERIIFLQEYWNKTDAEMESGLEATPLIWYAEPNTWLVNGQGISAYSGTDSASRALHVIDVTPGKTYRFRLIAATSLSIALFGFEEHKDFKIVAADGHYTKPHPVELLQMGSGQRLDALFAAKTCEELHDLGRLDFYMQLESRDRDAVVETYAILRYANTCGFSRRMLNRLSERENPTAAPLKLPPTISGYLDYVLRPLDRDREANRAPTAAEVTRRVFIKLQEIQNQYYIWQVNDNTWTEHGADPLPHTTPREPYLVALYRNQTEHLPDYDAAVANGGLDPRTRTYPVRMGEVIEVIWQQFGARQLDAGGRGGALDTHPLHAHGAHYWDMGGGDGAWDAATMEARLLGGAGAGSGSGSDSGSDSGSGWEPEPEPVPEPVRRDTTVLYRYGEWTPARDEAPQGWRAWRLRAEQAGVWMVHCHTLQHMVEGMQTVWVHGDAADLMRVGPVDAQGYLEYGGDVYGNGSHAPRVVHFHDVG